MHEKGRVNGRGERITARITADGEVASTMGTKGLADMALIALQDGLEELDALVLQDELGRIAEGHPCLR